MYRGDAMLLIAARITSVEIARADVRTANDHSKRPSASGEELAYWQVRPQPPIASANESYVN